MHLHFLQYGFLLLLATELVHSLAATSIWRVMSNTENKHTTLEAKAAITRTGNTEPTSQGSSPSYSAPRYIINFGDSYSQTGFNLAGDKPSPSNPLGNPEWPGWTTSNGNHQNWLDTLIVAHNTTVTYAINLASGGATTDASLIEGYAPYPTVHSFVDQVEEFEAGVAGRPDWVPWTAENTLFSVWIGVNDVGNGWYKPNWDTRAAQVADRYFELVAKLKSAGARRFVFLTVPPFYLTPLLSGGDSASVEGVAKGVESYNALLLERAEKLRGEGEGDGVQVWVVDTAKAMEAPVKDPPAFGARDKDCCSEIGTECLWFNNYHPGQIIHDQVAKAVTGALGGW